MLAVTILGNNSAVPAYGRHPTSQVVSVGNTLLLIDCGEGTQMQLLRYQIKRRKISHIFISHMHGDHYYGLVGLINSFALAGRLQPLIIFGPAILEQIIRMQLEAGESRMPYQLIFNTIAAGDIVVEKEYKVTAFETEHRIACFGFLVTEIKTPFKINGPKLVELNVPTDQIEGIRTGQDVTLANGTIIPNAELSLPNTPAKKYAFCADTRYTESFLPTIINADLIYHETTYLHHLAEQAYDRGHSTTIQAAELAIKANAQKLLIGHFSSKYDRLDELIAETRTVFPNASLAIEGETFNA
jgi:ribonuclease Z